MSAMPRKGKKPEQQLAEYWQNAPGRRRRFFLAAGGAIGAIVVLLGLFNIAYARKVFPGVRIGAVPAGGLTREVLAEAIDDTVRSLHEEPLIVSVGDQTFSITPTKDWELSYDIDRTVNTAFSYGRRNDFISSAKEQLSALTFGRNLAAGYRIKESAYRAWVTSILDQVEEPERDARIVFHGEELVVEPEMRGLRIPDNSLERSTRSALAGLDFSPINLSLVDVTPAVRAEQAVSVRPEIIRMVAADLLLTFEKRSLRFPRGELIGFIELAADSTASAGAIALVSESKVLQAVERIAKDIDQSPVDARLAIRDGRASVFTPSRDGYQVKREQAAKDIAKALEQRRANVAVTQVELAVEVTKPAVRTETINDLGIQELIGRATTSFAGSPPNRVHNIAVGASSFNGLLVKPGEVFSTVTALGRIDTAAGYKPELVIKEDRLIPETGGGLCQVSTTLFRAALDAGLDIVERRNHSFRVRYYEPPIGMDATIYDPAPDFKFRNDTPGYILIQSRVQGNSITFEFYGTKDGREVTISNPVVYNITSPGEPVYIEDPSLPPGEQKQIEKAVPGADARFTYTVKKDGQTLHQRTFTSRYVAWRAKYLVGPAAPPAPEPAPAIESTSE
jgi:vancomycin resistance protein YoaR